jgi:hypothetical protein
VFGRNGHKEILDFITAESFRKLTTGKYFTVLLNYVAEQQSHSLTTTYTDYDSSAAIGDDYYYVVDRAFDVVAICQCSINPITSPNSIVTRSRDNILRSWTKEYVGKVNYVLKLDKEC